MNKQLCVVIVFFASLHAATPPTFDESMGDQHIKWGQRDGNERRWYKRLKQRYMRCMSNKRERREEAKIPKRIHQIWLGSPFPKEYMEWQESWLELHPDWEYYLWTDEKVATLTLENQELYDSLANYGQKSDVLRYEILYQFGGVYLDTDFEALAPLDDLHHTYSFYAGISNGVGTFEVSNGIIGSRPRHPILRRCINKLKEPALRPRKLTSLEQYITDVVLKTGPVFFTRCIMGMEQRFNESLIILPSSYFFPLPYTGRHLSLEERLAYIRPESLAMHHWEHSWLKH